VWAEEFHDSIRPGLIAMLPRLKRFADLLVGERKEATALLRRALHFMLAEQHRYQRGRALDGWAFAEIYRQWLAELGDHADPMGQAGVNEESLAELIGDDSDAPTTASSRACPRNSVSRCSSSMVRGSTMSTPAACSTSLPT
jgi:RNA polymerase sigma-70 factor (ECF subfamily)